MSASAAKFFERDLPARASADVHQLFSSEGSIAFKVGEAAWTFRFASMEPVEPRFDRDAPLQLWFSEAAFDGLLDGTLDIADAIGRREVKARGELSLLELFGKFLQPGGVSLGWDAVP